MEAIEAADEDAFLDKLQAYDSMSKLDKWKTAMFLKIKEGIDAEPDLTWRTVYKYIILHIVLAIMLNNASGLDTSIIIVYYVFQKGNQNLFPQIPCQMKSLSNLLVFSKDL